MPGFLFDSHTHLDMEPLSLNPERVMERARIAGVTGMVTIGIDIESCERNIALAERFDDVSVAVGIHPHNAEEVTDEAMGKLASLASHPRVVAVGETGLDFYRDYADRDAQRAAFRKHLRMAKELNKPVVIHDRDAHGEVLRIIDEEGPPEAGGVFHCFSGSFPFARQCMERGFLISIPGVVTYPNAKNIAAVAKKIPTDRLLIETDAPFLSPHPHRGRANEPAYLIHTAEKIGELKGLTTEDVGRITTTNARRIFQIEPDFPHQISYKIRNSLYLNITNRCTNRCVFCSKRTDFFVKGHYLKLPGEPSVDEIVSSAGDVTSYDEVVFCGYGEPTLRLADMIEAARRLRGLGAKKLRLNTDGLANLIHGRNIIPELAGIIDSLSVSLNAPDGETYASLCPNPFGERSFNELLLFIEEAKKAIPEIIATVVAIPGLDIERCRKLAEGELKVTFRVREYNEVG
ncbi:MAG: YchF/TatD family DNA exonuclease [Deltaproteobacteria bacterium]|nr:YchF/TatD family DNA exonuclease [Deltaproteobacteria bacterium]NIS76351.1 YchF/TatD family DNA exonuclease [Deltaproteobacteria bacterium]